jgi:hypothetical protein
VRETSSLAKISSLPSNRASVVIICGPNTQSGIEMKGHLGKSWPKIAQHIDFI